MLTCNCGWGDAEWYWEPPEDYQTMPIRKRRSRCASCGELIEHGATVIGFDRHRYPVTEVEERIFGSDHDAVKLAAMWHCERCADLWWSLTELGYCVWPGENVPGLVREYAAVIKAAREDKP